MFYEATVRKDDSFLAGRSTPLVEIRLRLDRVAFSIIAVLALVGAAVYASAAGWPDIAKEILKLASSLVTGFLAGVGSGEKRSARRVSHKIRSAMSTW